MTRLRKRRDRTAQALNALLGTLLVAVLMSGCSHEQAPSTTTAVDWEEQLDAHKAAATQLLVQNSELREFVENDIYELDGEVFVTNYQSVEVGSAVILVGDKLIIPEGYDLEWYEPIKEYEATIVDLFHSSIAGRWG
jgi:ABC-type uncharacterized transport system auxiliary subunit